MIIFVFVAAKNETKIQNFDYRENSFVPTLVKGPFCKGDNTKINASIDFCIRRSINEPFIYGFFRSEIRAQAKGNFQVNLLLFLLIFIWLLFMESNCKQTYKSDLKFNL